MVGVVVLIGVECAEKVVVFVVDIIVLLLLSLLVVLVVILLCVVVDGDRSYPTSKRLGAKTLNIVF